MPRYFPVALLLLAFCLAGCSGRRGAAPDPVAQSGASSEDIWYPDGGARWAWTAIPRPRHLYTGLTGVRDPALYQAPQAQRAGGGKKSGARVKKAAPPPPPPRPQDCPPCPPEETNKRAPSAALPPAAPSATPVGQRQPLPAMPAASPLVMPDTQAASK